MTTIIVTTLVTAAVAVILFSRMPFTWRIAITAAAGIAAYLYMSH